MTLYSEFAYVPTSVDGRPWFTVVSGEKSESGTESMFLDYCALISVSPIAWPPDEHLKERAFYWICKNPGADAEDVSEYLGIPPKLAIELTESLLNEGLLGFES